MKGKLTFIGTGASMGVPIIGCQCEVCCSLNPHNQRLRPSALMQMENKKFLIDIGPDFRQQALRYQIHALDGLILTHAHHDHTAGLDDIRPLYYNRKEPLPILLSDDTAFDIQKRFDYLFVANPYLVGNRSKLDLHLLPNDKNETRFEGIDVHYVNYEQGQMKVNGFQFGSLAYLSDIKDFNESIFEKLQGIKTLIISALRFTPSPMHLSVDEAIDFAGRIEAEKVWITHISHDLDHEKTNAYLPPHVRLAHDGLTIDFG